LALASDLVVLVLAAVDLGSVEVDLGSVEVDLGSVEVDLGSAADLVLVEVDLGSVEVDLGSVVAVLGSVAVATDLVTAPAMAIWKAPIEKSLVLENDGFLPFVGKNPSFPLHTTTEIKGSIPSHHMKKYKLVKDYC
jgi:hypothetical protein